MSELTEKVERVWIDGKSYILQAEEYQKTDRGFAELVGLHDLDAVDFSDEKIQRYGSEFDDASICRFRLDGRVLVAIEDPNDGYRSSLGSLHEYDSDYPVKNVFPVCRVLVRVRTKRMEYDGACDILEFIDVMTGKTVLEVGTDNSEDYYPRFVANFQPENMLVNASAGDQPK